MITFFKHISKAIAAKFASRYSRLRIALIGVVLIGILYVLITHVMRAGETISVAVVGPLNTSDGDAMVKGARLLIEEVNAKGGIGGKQVELLTFDDQNTPEIARQQAQMIVEQPNVRVVLGHYYSAPALIGGAIYQRAGMPVITASALANDVAEGNDWSFRTTYSNRSLAAFLATYVKKILHYPTAAVIYSSEPYGESLKEDFQQAFTELEGVVSHDWGLDPDAADLDARIDAIVAELSAENIRSEVGIIVLATREPESAKVIAALKRKGLDYPLIGDDVSINEKFARYSEEEQKPGYFSNGVYAAIPMHFDLSSAQAQRFLEAFQKRYGAKPGITAMMYYDAAAVAVEAMKKANVRGKPQEAAQERQNLKDALSSFRNPKTAVQGVSGPIFFDRHGNLSADRPLTMGVFQNQLLTPALTQLTPVTDFTRIANLEQELEAERVLLVNQRYMYTTHLVQAGLEIQRISDLKIQDLSYQMEFFLWFRYQGLLPVENIAFLNAAEAVSLELARPEQLQGRVRYRLYQVKGRFKADFLPNLPGFGQQHVLGLSFHHRELQHDNLMYVIDTSGMGVTDEKSVLKKLQDTQVLSAATGWAINAARHFEDSIHTGSLGNPAYLNALRQNIEYSRVNTGIWIKRTGYLLRRMIAIAQSYIPIALTPVMVLLCGALMFGCAIAGKRKLYRPGSIRVVQAILLFILLLFGERFMVQWVGNVIVSLFGATMYTYYLNVFTFTVEILWFLLPAFVLTRLIDRFCWDFLEDHYERVVPHVIRYAVVYVIYVLTFFGIVKYVFGREITALAATSGVVALLIGFASKVDISNIFSGIGISLSEPFRIGDWVKINNLAEGKVIDMTSRVTKIETRDRTMLSIPNTMVAGGVIENYNYPDKLYRISFTLQTAPIYRYERVEKILLDAALSTDGVLKDPAPEIEFKGQGDSSSIFTVHFYVENYGKRIVYEQTVWRRVWRHLELAGIDLATPRREILMVQAAERDLSAPLTLLQYATIFHPLPNDVKTTLSERVRRHHIAASETIFRQGEASQSLYLIAEGVVTLWLQFGAGRAIELARVGVGECFGERGILIGEPRIYSAVALRDTELLELTKDALEPLFRDYPQVVECLENLVAERDEQIEQHKDHYQIAEIEKTTSGSTLLRKTKELLQGKKG